MILRLVVLTNFVFNCSEVICAFLYDLSIEGLLNLEFKFGFIFFISFMLQAEKNWLKRGRRWRLVACWSIFNLNEAKIVKKATDMIKVLFHSFPGLRTERIFKIAKALARLNFVETTDSEWLQIELYAILNIEMTGLSFSL